MRKTKQERKKSLLVQGKWVCCSRSRAVLVFLFFCSKKGQQQQSHANAGYTSVSLVTSTPLRARAEGGSNETSLRLLQ